MPRRTFPSWPLPWLVLLGALAYLQPTLGIFSGMLDEGLVLTPADRILHGEVVYRDFYLYTGPLIPYLFAGWMKLFGTSLEAAHLLLWLVRAASCALLYPVARRLVSPGLALAPPLMLLFSYAAEPNNLVGHWVANLLLALACALLVAWAGAPTPGGVVATGAALGLAVLGLHSFAALLGVAAVATVVFVRWGRGPGPVLRDLGLLALGGVAAVLPWLAWLGSRGALGAMGAAMVTSNLGRAGFEFIRLPTALDQFASLLVPGRGTFPFLTGLVLLGGLLALLVGTPLLWLRRPEARTPALFAVFACALALQAACLYRLLPSQVLMHGWLSFVLAVAVLDRAGRPGRVALVGFLLLFVPLGGSWWEASRRFRFPVGFPRGEARVQSEGEAAELRRLVRFLERKTAGHPEAFFIPYEPNLYFLMDLRNPTPYFQMRALQYGREQMADALAWLDRRPGAPVFFFPAYDSEAFLRANWPDLDLGAYRQQWDGFMQGLQARYEVEDFGAVQVLSRRGDSR